MTTNPLPTGATIGLLGGGQLARMLAVAAARLGFRSHVFDPDANAPAADLAAQTTCASYDDTNALIAFAQQCDVVTYEFENIPLNAIDTLAAHVPVRPDRKALEVSQDRLTEKQFLSRLGLDVAPFAEVNTLEQAQEALAQLGTPAILKTRRFGYDGKGQTRLSAPKDANTAMADYTNTPLVMEAFVPFTQEISVIAARGADGEVACYDPGENVHRQGILHTTTVPANVPTRLLGDGVLQAGRILNALEYVGVMGVEFFVTPQGLVVNEIAPRVHNSGHWTQNACAVDQFEQHIRAIAGWPLSPALRHSDVVMENLIGQEVARAPALAQESDVALHLYGKTQTRPGRKMGHANRVRARS